MRVNLEFDIPEEILEKYTEKELKQFFLEDFFITEFRKRKIGLVHFANYVRYMGVQQNLTN